MKLRYILVATSFLFAGVLSSSGVARADTTYNVSTVKQINGNITGWISGSGSSIAGFPDESISAFNFTASATGGTYVFDSSLSGATAVVQAQGFTTPDGTPGYIIHLGDGSGDFLNLPVSGSFNGGLTYIGGQQLWVLGEQFSAWDPAEVIGPNQPPKADISFSATPEPSSAALLVTGVLGIAGVLRRRRQKFESFSGSV